MRVRLTMAAAVLVLAAACSTTSTVHEPIAAPPGETYGYAIERRDMTHAALDVLEEALDARLEAAGRLASSEPAGHLEISIREYYMRDGTARLMSGVFAGRDRIVSDVRVVGRDGGIRGSFEVASSNALAVGTSAGLIERHAEEIVARLSD